MSPPLQIKIKSVFKTEAEKFLELQHSEDKWIQLERMHIIGQLIFALHLQTHWLMLNLAFEEAKPKEILGQTLRLILVFPGNLFGKLPIGNVGTTRVSAFRPMEVPRDIEEFLEL